MKQKYNICAFACQITFFFLCLEKKSGLNKPKHTGLIILPFSIWNSSSALNRISSAFSWAIVSNNNHGCHNNGGNDVKTGIYKPNLPEE